MEEKCVGKKDHGQCRNADTDRPQQYSGKRDFFMVKHVKRDQNQKNRYDQITQCIRVQAIPKQTPDRSKVCSFPVFRYKSSTRTEQEMQHNIRLQSRA